jgi:hypothetical protein
MLHRLQLLDARQMVVAPYLAVVDGGAKKSYGRVFDFLALFFGESSIHGLNHLVAKRRSFTEQ